MYPFNIIVNGEVVDSFKSLRFSSGITIWKDYCNKYGATEDVDNKGIHIPYMHRNPNTGVTVQLKVVLRKHEE